MGCNVSKRNPMQTASTPTKPLKKSSILVNKAKTVNVEKRVDSGRGSSATRSVISEPKESVLHSPMRPPHRVPKLHHWTTADQNQNDDVNKQDITNINAAPKGISYELKIDWPRDGVDNTSIVKSHPPKALRRLEIPASVKMNYDQLMRELHGADERKAKILKERKEQCQSRKAARNGPGETGRTSLEFRVSE